MSLECTCEDWKRSMPEINGYITLAAARSGFRHQYEGAVFRFCPWCSARLTEPMSEETIAGIQKRVAEMDPEERRQFAELTRKCDAIMHAPPPPPQPGGGA